MSIDLNCYRNIGLLFPGGSGGGQAHSDQHHLAGRGGLSLHPLWDCHQAAVQFKAPSKR